MALAAPTAAQEPPDTAFALDEIEVVVGSRAGIRNPAELAVPVDIYGSEELERLGEVDLGQVLARIAPSFNSQRFHAGDGAALHTATLRGMSPDQVLVLVNGKRRHGVAFPKVLAVSGMGTTGTDLRAIPVHAIKRIEVLREGAASQYGSDAIAGVINIVLKDAAQGVTASSYLGTTSWGDGGRLLASANTGIGLGSDGFLNLTMEFGRQEETTRSGEAATCFGPSESYAPCFGGGKKIQLQRTGEPDYESVGMMVNAAVPVSESAEFYAFGGYASRQAVSDGLYRKADWVPRTVSYVYPDGFRPKEESDLTDFSGVAGLRGELGEWSADVSVGAATGKFDFSVANSINASYAAEYRANNPDAPPEAIAANGGPTSAHSGTLELQQFDLNVDAARDISLGGKPSHLALGAAFRTENFSMGAGDLASYACGPSNKAGSFPAAHHLNPGGEAYASCGMQGYPGYSPASAEQSKRDRFSVGTYADLEVRPAEGMTLGGALRFENYSDAGTSITGKVAGRYELGESGAALRGAFSTGFRAPKLPQRGFNTVIFQGGGGGLTSTGFLPEGDPIACEDFGVCSLKHETSVNLAGGLVYSHEAGFQLTADYYWVAVDDAIVLTEGLNQEHGLRANAQLQGRPVNGVAFWANAVNTQTQGLDVIGTWRFRGMDWGAADLSASIHRNSTEIAHNRNTNYIRETQELLLTAVQPKQRLRASLDVRSARGIGASLRVNHIGSVTTPFVFEVPAEIPAATIADAEITFHVGGRIRTTLGANNLLDKLPDKLENDPNNPDFHVAQLWAIDYPLESPYGLLGRVTYIRVDIIGP